MSKEFHVSARTISEALGILEKEGLVQRQGGSGTYVRSRPVPDPSKLDSGKPVAEKIADSLAREISLGNIRTGDFLPLQKTLRYQFGTSPGTLSKALRILEKRRLVHRRGNSRVAGPSHSRRTLVRQRVVVLSTRSIEDGTQLHPRIQPDFLRAFEKELLGNGAAFSGQFGLAPIAPRVGKKGDGENDLGYLFPASRGLWMDKVIGSTPDPLNREMDRAAKLDRPVVVFNCAPILSRFPSFSFARHRNLFALRRDNARAGSEVGVYLGQLGHRRIAYFSYAATEWNEGRWKGIKEGHHDVCGNEGKVMGFHAESDDRIGRRIVMNQHERARESLEKWGNKFIEGYQASHSNFTDAILSEYRKQVYAANHAIALKPLFERALKDPRITAWVGADGRVAHAAGRYLSSQKIPIPKKLSLIGIDDRAELADRGIAAYDFQMDRVGYLAAHCILGDIPIRRNRKGIVDCPGRIIERGSVARATQ